MSDLNIERGEFEAAYWNPTALDWFDFIEERNCYVDNNPHIGKFPHENEELIHQLSQLNNSWCLWQKAKLETVPNEVINEIQSWVAVKSFSIEDAHPDLPIIDANELAEFIEQLVKGESGAEQ